MKQNPREDDSCSADQEIPCLSRNLKVHYHVHKSGNGSILNKLIHIIPLTTYLFKVH
jgi:hypothetical protein